MGRLRITLVVLHMGEGHRLGCARRSGEEFQHERVVFCRGLLEAVELPVALGSLLDLVAAVAGGPKANAIPVGLI